MPEGHHWAVRRFSGAGRCESWGCPDPATFETIYIYQHEGEDLATRKTKHLCHRHAQGWAQTYRVDWTYGDAVYPTPTDPLSRDDDLEPRPRQPGAFRPPLMGLTRLAWWRRRL